MVKPKPKLERIEANAGAFGISPELAWLMDAQPRWDALRAGIMEINKGITLEDLVVIPVAQLRSDLITLETLLRRRQ